MSATASVVSAASAKSAQAGRLRKLWDTGLLVQVTRFGVVFVLVTVVVAVGATNTGNNGLYVLLSLFLSALVVSGLVSRRNVSGLVPALEGPDEVFAGEAGRFWLTLRDDLTRERVAILVRLEERDAPYLFPTVPRGATASRPIDLVHERRGIWRIGSLTVFSSYPIGLFRKGRRRPAGLEVLVFPKPSYLPLPEPEVVVASGDGGSSERRGRGAGIRNLREALPGDDPRDIHWPQTARQGTPIVRERDSEDSRMAVVVLEGGPGDFEGAVSEAAGAVLTLLSHGDRVGLSVGEVVVPPGRGPQHRRALLSALSLAERTSARSPRPALPLGAALYLIRPRDGRLGR